MEAIGEDGSLNLESEVTVAEAKDGYTYFEDSDVIVAKITPCFENGKGALLRGLRGGKGFGTTELHVLRANSNLEPRFLWWLTASPAFRDHGAASMLGAGGQKRVTPEFVLDYRFQLPDLNEQRWIADYLDRETSKIDGLIEEKERLLKVLDERRQALINEAVTRGLDPSASMKPSGLPWLGDIPVHWKLVQAKRCIKKILQGWSPEADARPADLDEWGVMRAGCVNGGKFDPNDNKALQLGMSPDQSLEIIEGDVLMSRANTRSLLGSCALVQPVRRRLMLCDKLFRLTLDPTTIDPKFYVLAASSRYFRFQLEGDATGASSSMQNIGQDTVRNSMLALPPQSEQSLISDHVQRQDLVLASIGESVRKGLASLADKRQSLINQALTGQLPARALT